MALTNEQIDELRGILTRELRKLKRSLKVAEESLKPVTLDQQSVGRLSRMDAMQSQAMSQRLEARDLERLERLRRTLERLESGDFGVCTGCGGDIGFERLSIFPETESCGQCGGS
jgi:DnaK suppressor protein